MPSAITLRSLRLALRMNSKNHEIGLTAKCAEKAQRPRRVVKVVKPNPQFILCVLCEDFAHSAVSSSFHSTGQEIVLVTEFTE